MPNEPAAAAPLFADGAVVGGAYRVVGALASGGMGVVYEVEQLATGARRALKAMNLHMARDARLRARFVQEARVGAVIKSDHVASILDAGVDDATGIPYLVMELLEGRTLSRELRHRGAFTWTEVAEIMRQIGHALAAAHAAGVVHRDLKPANIYLAASRTAGSPYVIKLLDFGIAKVVADAHDGATAVIGTPAWMAPEQTEAEGVVGPPADVWAVGLLAFMLFVGRHYWPSANHKSAATATVMRDLVLGEIVPASIRAASYEAGDRLPPGFDAWFARCVDRDPDKRFADAKGAFAAFADVMRPLVAAESTPSLANMAAPSLPPPSMAGRAFAPPSMAATGDVPTIAEGAVSRSRSRVDITHSISRRRRGFGVAAAVIAVLGGAAAAAFAIYPRLGAHAAPAASASASASAASTPPSRIVLRLHGSNTIGAELAPALAEAFLERRTGDRTIVRRRTGEDEMVLEAGDGASAQSIEIFAHGSSTGFTDLASGACDVAMASRRIRPNEVAATGGLAPAASEHVIALDGIAVIVNPSNGVSRLSKAQLAQIFSGKVARWSPFAGNDDAIHVHARDDKSGTFDVFKTLVLGGLPLTSDATRHESSDRLSDAVAADPDAIGFVGLASVRSAKALMVEDATSQALVASPLTISTEDYPLTRRLYLYTSAKTSDVGQSFVDFAVSDDGQAIVPTAGFVDLRPECSSHPAPCATCSAKYRTATAGACRANVSFRFDSSSEQLDTRGLRDLQRLTTALARPEYGGKSAVLLGFSDSVGSRAENVQLSLARAQIVADQLRARGVPIASVVGLGDEMPLGDNKTDDGRERNRRVELWLR